MVIAILGLSALATSVLWLLFIGVAHAGRLRRWRKSQR